MKNLIWVEWLKLWKQRGFHAMLLFIFIFEFYQGLFAYRPGAATLSWYETYLFSATNILFMSFYFAFFAGIFVASGFSNRTYGMAFFNGCPRAWVIFSKFLIFIAGVFCIWLINTWTPVIIVSFGFGFAPVIDAGTSIITYYDDITLNNPLLMLLFMPEERILFTFLRLMVFSLIICLIICAFLFLLAVCIKSVTGTIAAGIFFIIIMFQIARLVINLELVLWLWNNMPLYIGVCIISITVILIISLFVFHKSEYK